MDIYHYYEQIRANDNAIIFDQSIMGNSQTTNESMPRQHQVVSNLLDTLIKQVNETNCKLNKAVATNSMMMQQMGARRTRNNGFKFNTRKGTDTKAEGPNAFNAGGNAAKMSSLIVARRGIVGGVAINMDGPKNPSLYKTQFCKNMMNGSCKFGPYCWFAHSPQELRQVPLSTTVSTFFKPNNYGRFSPLR